MNLGSMFLDIKEMLGILSGSLETVKRRSSNLPYFTELTTEWDFPQRTWIRIVGLEVVQKPEGMVGGGSMDVVLPISTARTWGKTKRAMMEFYGTSMARTTEVSNLQK